MVFHHHYATWVRPFLVSPSSPCLILVYSILFDLISPPNFFICPTRTNFGLILCYLSHPLVCYDKMHKVFLSSYVTVLPTHNYCQSLFTYVLVPIHTSKQFLVLLQRRRATSSSSASLAVPSELPTSWGRPWRRWHAPSSTPPLPLHPPGPPSGRTRPLYPCLALLPYFSLIFLCIFCP